MGPKVKKSVKNSFSFFLEDYVKKQREKGRHVSYRVGAEECAPLWQELSNEEKQKYDVMAKAHKQNMKSNPANKYTGYGESYLDVQKRLEIKQKKIDDADHEIKSTISNLDLNRLPLHLFYIIHCNYYCKTDTGLYVPGEIAISEFSLKDGLRRTYHQLIDPGEIPLGFAYEAQQNIKEIHGLPYPPYPQGNTNFYGIYTEIKNFLEPGKMPDGRLPPLYCLEKNIPSCENILENLSEKENEMPFRVYALHKMFFTLKNKCTENVPYEDKVPGFPVLTNAILELEKDVFCYVPGISCNFHLDLEDKYHNCSLSIVTRFVYVVCDHCCEFLQIAIIPGKHGRLKCDLNRGETVKEILQNANVNENDTKTKEVKSEVSPFDTLYSKNNPPEWVKITSSSFYDDMESVCSDLASLTSYGRGRGRGRPYLSDSDDEDFESCLGVVGKKYDDEFPSLGRGRGRGSQRNDFN